MTHHKLTLVKLWKRGNQKISIAVKLDILFKIKSTIFYYKQVKKYHWNIPKKYVSNYF